MGRAVLSPDRMIGDTMAMIRMQMTDQMAARRGFGYIAERLATHQIDVRVEEVDGGQVLSAEAGAAHAPVTRVVAGSSRRGPRHPGSVRAPDRRRPTERSGRL